MEDGTNDFLAAAFLCALIQDGKYKDEPTTQKRIQESGIEGRQKIENSQSVTVSSHYEKAMYAAPVRNAIAIIKSPAIGSGEETTAMMNGDEWLGGNGDDDG